LGFFFLIGFFVAVVVVLIFTLSNFLQQSQEPEEQVHYYLYPPVKEIKGTVFEPGNLTLKMTHRTPTSQSFYHVVI
jgi:heme/copper-type cytochrome/quinol oxidase subunit 1